MHSRKRSKKRISIIARVREQSELEDKTEVWVTTDGETVEGVGQTADPPRSYIVETPSGEVCRNGSQLNVAPQTTDSQETSEEI